MAYRFIKTMLDYTLLVVFNFFPEFNIRIYDKNSESDYFFFLHQNQNIFFSNIVNQNISLENNHNPPLQVKWSFPKHTHHYMHIVCKKSLKIPKE